MKTSDIYSKLGAEKDEDILSHFPKRYEDLSLTDLSKKFYDNEKVVVLGYYEKMTLVQGGRLIRMNIKTDYYSLETPCVIYNQPFYARILKREKKYFFFGIYKNKSKTLMIIQIIADNSLLVQNRYKPYYNLKNGISQGVFYTLVRNLLSAHTDYILPVIPKKYREKYKLEDRVQAYKDVHIPVDINTINRGLRLFKYEEALKYCIKTIYAKKKASVEKKNTTAKIDKIKINEFIKNLNFKLTKDQTKSVVEIVEDMDKTVVMNRLLQGDVGTGKTVVAFIALYANFLRGGQGVLLAPTVALARQHYQTALSIFNIFPLNIQFLENTLTAKQKRDIKSELKKGNVDIIIGTHNVFSDDVIYKNLTLCIIDEQHKFGVKQRQKLLSKGSGLDRLMMSATPIPQTLSRIINSDLDVSFLDEFPFKERRVSTRLVNSTDEIIDREIQRCLTLNKQVFIVAPKIEKGDNSSRKSSALVYEEIAKEFGKDKVALLTGKTIKKEQEQIYSDFANGKKLILVSTSIIEVGVDVQNAGLMIIYAANYFGLASLHQLRGRIGRNGNPALTLLVYDGDDLDATEKLEYLTLHSKGQDVARFDLEQRGSGSLGSEKQSGDSDLQVANFVKDIKIFECAKADALEILSDLKNPENFNYAAKYLKKDE